MAASQGNFCCFLAGRERKRETHFLPFGPADAGFREVGGGSHGGASLADGALKVDACRLGGVAFPRDQVQVGGFFWAPLSFTASLKINGT